MCPADKLPFEALNSEQMRDLMSPGTRKRLSRLTLLDDTDSTNSFLQRLPANQQHAHAVFAESQSQGRGRRERNWYSPPGCNIYLSLGWQFGSGERLLSSLPLVVAVCACRALSKTGLSGHGIKWPNDILHQGSKLAGILVEMQASPGGPANAVIGLGLNVRMSPGSVVHMKANEAIDRDWTDLASHMPPKLDFSRNTVAAALLEALLDGVPEFESSGFDSFLDEWESLDLLAGRKVRILQKEESTEGVARGIDPDGGLKIDVSPGNDQVEQRVFHAGEVSVQHG